MRKHRRIAGTARTADHRKPRCKQCGHDRNVMRLHGMWVCSVHLKVKQKARRSEIVIPGMDSEKLISVRDVFPNRRARRASKAT